MISNRVLTALSLSFVWRQMIVKGKFIVLEGLDRSGKSTIASYIHETLSQSNPTVAMNFPDRTTPVGQMINEFLNNKTDLSPEAIHLLFSANRWEKMDAIKKALEAGTHVVCDRYWYSGVAYSTAKGMDFEWCKAPDKGLIEPDLVIYLQASPELLTTRANYGQQRYERLEFQTKVKESFDKLFEGSRKVQTIDVGTLSLEELKQKVKPIVLNLTK